MPCYFPLHAFKGKKKENGKIEIAFNIRDSWKGERLEIPCGQCIGCRLEKSRQWATRCMHESSLYDENSFITLTYDDQNLPKNNSLEMRDVQLFMKRLRKKEKRKKIRFFQCGEYGEETNRPHYHSILFNHDFTDKKYYKTQNGNKLYTSNSLDNLWEKGMCVIGDVSFESAGYVARYSLKKITGENANVHYQGRKPEFVTMSRKPGIGFKWIQKYVDDVYPNDHVIVRGSSNLPPRYYDNYLDKVNPGLLIELKKKREKNERFIDRIYNGRKIKESDSSDYRLAIKEKVKRSQIGFLTRK